jgi:chromosome partitioning protein
MIVTFGNTKGGTGKSTLSVNLAIRLAAKTKKVLLVDGDEQRSAVNFTELRSSQVSDYTAIALYGSSLRTQINRLKPDYDVIVIDVGGRDTGSFRAALTLTDTLIIPVQPRTFDVWALDAVAALVNDAQAMNPNLKAYVCLNLAEAQGKDNAFALTTISDYTFTIIKQPIMRRKVYPISTSQGKSVFECKPMDRKAIAEFDAALSFLYPQDSH